MDDGQDVLIPHPDFSMFGISDRAIIDVADSLAAVKKLVFDREQADNEGAAGRAEHEFCRAAGRGNPPPVPERAEIRQRHRRGGHAGAKDISAFSAGVITGYDNSPFRPYMISREGLAWHYYGGLGVGALPNGRKALEPLNDGSVSPMRGADTNGPTAVIRSVLKAGFEDSYAHVLNQKFMSTILQSPESLDKLKTFTETFFRNGGTHIQYNITDKEELQEAKVEPEEHRDLVVRIGGFSAYFVQLSPEIQDDVITRSEQLL